MKLYIGIDGGASSTRGVLIDENGKTLDKIVIKKGTNLKAYEDLAPKRIVDLILDLCTNQNISIDDINAFGFGLASVSYDEGREKLFKELDRINISDKSILINDAEAAYKVVCEQNVGILVTVGTGIICIAKDKEGHFFRTAGLGHDKDTGSGYWIGNQAFLKLALNEGVINHDKDLLEIYDIVIDKFNKDDLVGTLEYISEDDNTIALKASLAEDIILISEHNEVARNIVQEATYNLSDHIISLVEILDYEQSNELLLFGNGSIIKSDLFRSSLNDSLSFNYSKVNWFFSKLSSAYGSAIIAALSKDKINIKIKDILKGDYLVSC